MLEQDLWKELAEPGKLLYNPQSSVDVKIMLQN